jgi:hypothetical protein
MTLTLHGVTFNFSGETPELRGKLKGVLSTYGFSLDSPAVEEPDACLHVESVQVLPSLPSGLRKVGVDNNGVVMWQGDDLFCLQTPDAMFTVDLAAKRALGSVSRALGAEMGAPVMWLTMWSLNLFLRGYRFFPLHAAALTQGGGPGLIATGASGSGKSTLACNLLHEGWQFLSDDTVLLRPDADGVDVYAFRTNFSLREDSRTLFPDLLAHGQERPTGERKHWVPVRTLYPQQATDRCTPRVLVFPEISDRAQSRVTPMSPVEALHCLVGQSALVRFRRDWAEEHLAMLVRLTHQAQSYRLEAGQDLLEHPSHSHQLLAPLLGRSLSAKA